MDAIALLADTWNDNLDPEVSAQLVQASAQAYFSFGKEKGKVKVKPKARARADILFRPSHLSFEDRRRRLKETEGKNRLSCLWSKGTLGKRSRMCNASFGLVHTKPDTYSSYGETTASLPTERIRLQCVSFSTNTATTPIHPHV